MNINNFAVVSGRLAKDSVSFNNSDGSKKVYVTVMVDNNFVGKDGKRKSHAISLEAFVPASVDGLGVFDLMHKGDLVGFECHIEADNYTGADGKAVYAQKIVIDGVDLRETKATTTARLEARKVAEAAEAAGVSVVANPQTAPAPAEGASPFAG